MMDQLTKYLKAEVMADIYVPTLKTSRLLKLNFKQTTLEKMSLFIKERKYAPDEILFQKSEIANKLIFILSGEIEIFVN